MASSLTSLYPTLSDAMASRLPSDEALGRAATALRAGTDVATTQANQPGPFMGGVYEGAHNLLGGIGSLGAALGNVSGNKWLQEGGENVASQQKALAQKYGRPELDTAPWQEGGGGWSKALPWLAHGAGAMVPTMAAVLGGSALGAAAAPAVGVGASVGGLIGGAATMYPGAVGGLYDAAAASPEGPTPGKSAAALVGGVPLAGLMALGPETSAAIVGRGPLAGAAPALEKAMQGKITQRVVTGAATQSAVGAVQGGVQTGAEMAFRPDIPVDQKMQHVVDATTSGAALGGILGGVLGVHKMKLPQDASPNDMKGYVDAVVKPPEGGGDSSLGVLPVTHDPNKPMVPGGAQGYSTTVGEVPSPPNPMAQRATPELMQQMAAVEQRLKAGSTDPNDLQQHAMLQQELAKPERAPVVQGPVAQGELALEGGRGQPPVDVSAQVRAQQQAFLGLAKGGVAKAPDEAIAFAKGLTATSRPELIDELRQKVEGMGDQDVPKALQPLLKALKIIGPDGSPTEVGPDGEQAKLGLVDREYTAAKNKLNMLDDRVKLDQEDPRNVESTFEQKKKNAEAAKKYRETTYTNAEQMFRDHQEADIIAAKREAEPKVAPKVDPESLWAVAKTPADEEAANILTRKAQGKGFFDDDTTPITDATQQKEQARFDQTGGLPRPGEGEAYVKPSEVLPSELLTAKQELDSGRHVSVAGNWRLQSGGAWEGGKYSWTFLNIKDGRQITLKDGPIEGSSPIPPESQTGMVDPAMAALYPGSMDSMFKTTPSPMKSVLHPSIMKDWEDYAKLHGDARLLGNSRTIEGAGSLGTSRLTPEGTPGRMANPLVSGASIEVGDWSGLRRNFPTPTTPALPVNRTGLSQAAQGWNAKFGAIKSIAVAGAEAGPKAVGEFETVIGQLKAILAKESDRDGQAYSEKTRADAQAALWAVSQGDAGPANRLLSSPELSYRATKDYEGQYEGPPRSQEEVRRRAEERAATDANVVEGEKAGRKATQAAQAAARPAMADPEFQTAFVRAISALGEMAPGAQQSFKVIGTAGELPKEVLADMVARKVNPNLVRGTMVQNPDGTVSRYIIRDRMKTVADVQEVVAHEYVHGQTGDFVLNQIYDKAKGLHTLLEAARQKGVLEELKDVIPGLKETLDGIDPKNKTELAAAIKETEERLTAEDKADVVDELLALVGGKRVGKDNTDFFKRWGTTIREGFSDTLKLLGLNDYAKKVDAFNAIGALQALRDMRGIEPDTSPTGIRQKVMYNRTPQAKDDNLSEAMRLAVKVKEDLNAATGLSAWAQKVKLFWNSTGSFYKEAGHLLPSLKEYDTAGERKGMMNTILLMPGRGVLQDIIGKLDTKGINFLHKAMAASYSGIDASKPWEAQPWLHNLPNRDELRRLTGEANQAYNQLGQKGGQEAFKQAALVGQWQQLAAMATQLHYLMTDQYGHTGPNPIDVYHDTTAIQGKLAESHQFMRQQVDSLLAEADVLSARKTAENPLAKSEKTPSANSRRMGKIIPIDDLRQLMGYVKGAIDNFDKVPYFKMGRIGDHYVAAKLRKLENGMVDPAAVAEFEKLKNDAGFTRIDMNAGAQTNSFYSRFENTMQMDAFNKVIAKARDLNLLDATAKNDKGEVDYGISSGRATQPNTMKSMAPSWMQGILARVDADGTLPQTVKDQIKNLWLDMIPDNSLSKSYQPREGVHGQDADILRSMGNHNANFANALAGSVAASHQRPAIAKMARDLEAMNRDPLRSTRDKEIAAGIIEEIIKRQTAAPWRIERGIQDFVIGVNHVYALGLSPGYALQVLSQNPILLWPTLSEKFGYVQSAKAIASVTPRAFKIVEAIFAGKDRLSGVANEDVLRKGGISESDIKKVMGAAIRGDLYSFTQSAIKETGGKEPLWQRTVRWANIAAVYAELISRTISTLASHELYEKGGGKGMSMDAHEYAHYVNDQSMMRWDQDNAARATTKAGGIAGPLSPVMTRFMGYQIKMVETLYRKIGTAFEMDAQNKYTTAAERKQAVTEARRFLLSHMAAVTTLAGTMGLPAAAWVAGAATKLTGNLPGSLNPTGISWDAQESYREFLSYIFGGNKTMAEVAAHGVPRALGFDMAQSFGDDRLLPFLDIMTDRRKIEEAAPDWAANMFGSPWSMVVNFAKGARDIGTGNVLQGMKEMAPTGLKSLIEAYRMSDRGYVDNSGHPMSLTPDARDILAQAVGFTPSKKAEYQEEKRAETGRAEDIQFRSGVLKRNFMMAFRDKNPEAMKAAADAIKEHDRAAPQLAIGPSLKSYAKSWMEAPELSKAVGLPVGANLRDYIHNQQSRGIYNW